MSRLGEWIDRQLSVLDSNIKECLEKTKRAHADIGTWSTEIQEYQKDRALLVKAKNFMEQTERTEDPNGQLKLQMEGGEE